MAKQNQKILLLENIHPIAAELFEKSGFKVELQKNSLSEDELIAKLKNFDALGIRSKTQITEKVLKESPQIQTVGCYCIGTNQVDLKAARTVGMPVFNAPFSNTRSVAEMTISNLIALSRKIGQRNVEMHQGIWNKESEGCFEVRGKTLGIVGYGNIGTQVSMLAESIGMRVIFFDVVTKLPLGNAKPVSSLEELLAESDFVTLHVPETAQTMGLMGPEQFKAMKEGSYLLNASRGTVVDIDALVAGIKEKRVAGAALDVYPQEPEAKNAKFATSLQGLSNVILTPHIGGATEEAQVNIGNEVASTMIRYLETGSTTGTVNFPKIDMPQQPGSHRILNVHKNVPGVLKEINRIISEEGANILGQALSTDPELGYLAIDLDIALSAEAIAKINGAKNTIRTRMIS